MPRVENCGPSVNEFCLRTGDGSSTHDVCADCAQELLDDPRGFNDKLTPYNGEKQGEEGWLAQGCQHPSYEDEDYRCTICNALLNEDDD